jgi:hypothetical protein
MNMKDGVMTVVVIGLALFFARVTPGLLPQSLIPQDWLRGGAEIQKR